MLGLTATTNACKRGLQSLLASKSQVIVDSSDTLGLWLLSRADVDLELNISSRLITELAQRSTSILPPMTRLVQHFVGTQLDIQVGNGRGIVTDPPMPPIMAHDEDDAVTRGSMCRAILHGRLTESEPELIDVARIILRMQPYPGPSEARWVDYVETVLLVCEWVDVLSDWGKLCLRSGDFAHEYLYVTTQLPIFIHQRDVYLVARLVVALYAFGVPDNDSLLVEGRLLLLSTQDLTSGTWCMGDPWITVAAARALVPRRRQRGVGPWMKTDEARQFLAAFGSRREANGSDRALAAYQGATDALARETVRVKQEYDTQQQLLQHLRRQQGLRERRREQGRGRGSHHQQECDLHTKYLPDGRPDERICQLRAGMKRVLVAVDAVAQNKRKHEIWAAREVARGNRKAARSVGTGVQDEEDRSSSSAAAAAAPAAAFNVDTLRRIARSCTLTGVLVRTALVNKAVAPALASLERTLGAYGEALLARPWRHANAGMSSARISLEWEEASDVLYLALVRLLEESAALSVSEHQLRAKPQVGKNLGKMARDTCAPPMLQDAAKRVITTWKAAIAAVRAK